MEKRVEMILGDVVSGGSKYVRGTTPIVTTNWQNIECGFKPKFIFFYTGTDRGLSGYLYLNNDSYYGFDIWAGFGNGGIEKDVIYDDVIQPTDSGFKIKRNAEGIGNGAVWEYVALEE